MTVALSIAVSNTGCLWYEVIISDCRHAVWVWCVDVNINRVLFYVREGQSQSSFDTRHP